MIQSASLQSTGRDNGPPLKGGAIGIVALVIVLLLPIALLGPNTVLALYAIGVLALGVAALYRPGEPPILLLVFGYQWLQASLTLFYGNLVGRGPDFLSRSSGQHEEAIFLLLTGLLVLAISMKIAIGPVRRDLDEKLMAYITSYSVARWFAVYLASWLFSEVCLTLSGMSEGLRQPLLFLGQVKWATFFCLTVASFAPGQRSKGYWLVAFCLELAISVGGYFASFSDVFFYTLVSMAANRNTLRPRTVIPLAIVGSIMLLFAVIWSGVKMDYRDYVNQGTSEQVVLVSYGDRLSRLAELVGKTDSAALKEDVDTLVSRVVYFEFFGLVLDRVPSGMPHANGELWGQAAIMPFTPRLLFPNKPVLNDTALTMRYTGIYQPAWLRGTSVSLGYMTEAYIDFGPVLMFGAIGMLGFGMGFLYRWLLNQSGQRAAIGAALAPMSLMPQRMIESSIFKLLPPLVLAYIGSWFILNFVAPRLFGFLGRANPGQDQQRMPYVSQG